MPELHIHMKALILPIEPIVEDFAVEWNCELQPLESGYLLLPEIMMRKYGVFIFPMDQGWRICREEDATTWEDFLFVNLAHRVAAEFGGTLLLEGYEEPISVNPAKFMTFDHYVEAVVEKEDNLVKDMKRHWIYVHRSRSVR